jgi:hypothetical protein
MKHKYFLLFLIYFVSCENDLLHETKTKFSSFVEFSNKVLKEEWRYFELVSRKDTLFLDYPLGGKNIYLTTEIYKIGLSKSEKTELIINFYGCLHKKELEFLKNSFNDRQSLGEVTSNISMNNYYCELTLKNKISTRNNDALLLNIEKTLLQNYIKTYINSMSE